MLWQFGDGVQLPRTDGATQMPAPVAQLTQHTNVAVHARPCLYACAHRNRQAVISRPGKIAAVPRLLLPASMRSAQLAEVSSCSGLGEGASGSGAFNTEGRLVAIHVAGRGAFGLHITATRLTQLQEMLRHILIDLDDLHRRADNMELNLSGREARRQVAITTAAALKPTWRGWHVDSQYPAVQHLIEGQSQSWRSLWLRLRAIAAAVPLLRCLLQS